MIKFDQGFSATGIYEEGYDVRLINIILIGSSTAVVLLGVYSSAAEIADVIDRNRNYP